MHLQMLNYSRSPLGEKGAHSNPPNLQMKNTTSRSSYTAHAPEEGHHARYTGTRYRGVLRRWDQQ